VAVGVPNVIQGHTGMREWVGESDDVWERQDATPLEIVDAGDVFVVLGHFNFRARHTGIELDSPYGVVYRAEQGLIVLQRDFADWNQALRAAGIQTGPQGPGTKAGTKLSDSQ
jgi:ketosteroid isomerase-like protein